MPSCCHRTHALTMQDGPQGEQLRRAGPELHRAVRPDDELQPVSCVGVEVLADGDQNCRLALAGQAGGRHVLTCHHIQLTYPDMVVPVNPVGEREQPSAFSGTC